MPDDGGEATDEISYAGRVVAIAIGGNGEIKEYKIKVISCAMNNL